MARYQKQRVQYPMGSISSGTMLEEDLIPVFAFQLWRLARGPGIPRKRRIAHLALIKKIESNIYNTRSDHGDDMREQSGYWYTEESGWDLESLFDALQEYAGPYFYFGAHPGDGADYGFWLSEDWDEEFQDKEQWYGATQIGIDPNDAPLKVNDLSQVPSKFRGEVAVVNDHGNVTLYVKTSRTLREIWGVV